MDTARHQVTNHLTIESNFDNGELAILATDKKLAVRRYDWLATQPDNPPQWLDRIYRERVLPNRFYAWQCWELVIVFS